MTQDIKETSEKVDKTIKTVTKAGWNLNILKPDVKFSIVNPYTGISEEIKPQELPIAERMLYRISDCRTTITADNSTRSEPPSGLSIKFTEDYIDKLADQIANLAYEKLMTKLTKDKQPTFKEFCIDKYGEFTNLIASVDLVSEYLEKYLQAKV